MTVHSRQDDFLLRDLCEEDAGAFLVHLNDPDVVGWLARPPYPYRREHAAEFLSRVPGGWPHRAGIDIGGVLVGVVSVDPHLGYWLAPACWGRGIMARAARLLLDAHFAQTAADHVDSGVFDGNARSFNLLKKLGFAETGRRTVRSVPLGRDRPHIDMRLTRTTWEAQ